MENFHNLQDKIDYIFENKDAVYSLAEILAHESDEYETKSDVVQLLAALTAYPSGLTLVLRCADVWKERQSERYRFGPLINELRQCENLSYVTTLTILVNCILAGCDCVEDRNRLRNELLGLQLQEAFDKLRMSPAVPDNSELNKQLDAFDERKMTDEIQLVGPDGVDLNSHADIFESIMKQVSQKPHEILFLNILQHLLQIDSRDSLSDIAWEAAEKLVCRAKLISSKEEADKLLRIHALSVDVAVIRNQCQCGVAQPITNGVGNVHHELETNNNNNNHNNSDSVQKSSRDASRNSTPPVITNGNGPPAPLPPPLPPSLFNFRKSPNSANANNNNNNSTNNNNLPPRRGSQTELDVPDCQNSKFDLPAPKQKLKTFAWNKLPLGKIVNNGENIWSKAAANKNFDGYSLDFDNLENLFCQNSISSNSSERKNSSALLSGSSTSLDQQQKKKRENNEINLLDSKRSLNVNIFLRQFKGDIQDLVDLITNGNGNKIGLEKLRSLIKLMPESDEIDALTHFADDKLKLGSAEKFFLALIGVNNYHLRVECMLLKEEFTTILDYIRPSIRVIISAATDLKNNKLLQEILYLVLLVGNYLNSGSYGGNAAGFKLTSLWKLMEIRANKPNMTLLHYVALEADKNKPVLLEFPNQMKHLEEASKVSIDTIATDFRSLKDKTDRLSKQLSSNVCLELWNQMADFLESSKRELINVQRKLDEMERLRSDLASFFCEDHHGFKMEDCFKIFHNFCTHFNKAIDENNERKIKEEKAEMRRKLKEQHQQQQTIGNVSPYENGPFIRNSYERRSLNASRSHELLDVLNRSQESLDAEENLITNSKVRRSLRRKVSAMNDIMASSTERERPLRPWRQRLQDLLTDEDAARDKAKLRYSLDLSPVNGTCNTEQPTAASSCSSMECSPIYAKTFGPNRIETARMSSTTDVRQPTIAASIIHQTNSSRDSLLDDPIKSEPPNKAAWEPSKATWRMDRDKRSQSLYNGVNSSVNGSCAEDLNKLLETLESEKKQHETMIIGRRYSRSFRGSSSSADLIGNEQQTRNYRSWSNHIKEEPLDTFSAAASEATLANRSFGGSPSVPQEPRSRSGTTDGVFEANGFRSWRDRIKEEIPDYNYSVHNDEHRPIDEVVRHVEKTRDDIEKFALTLDTTDNKAAIARRDADHLDSGVDLRRNGSETNTSLSSTKSSLDMKEESVDIGATENESLTTECMVDFSLPASYQNSNYHSNEEDTAEPVEVPVPHTESLKIVKPSIAADWRSPRSPEDQSDARSTESPTESVCDRDEGFETEETQSAIIRRQQALQMSPLAGSTPSSLPSNTKAIIRPMRQPIYMSMTKASSIRGNLNSIDKPGQPTKPGSKLRPSTSANAIGSAYKRVGDKNTQTKLTSGDLQEAKTSISNSNTAIKSSSISKVPSSVPKFNPADYRSKRSTLLRSNTNASSSSQDESPVRKPSVGITNNNSKSSSSSSKLSSMKTPRTVASKQKLIQIRNNKAEALKDNVSSSDSEHMSPSTVQKRIPPKLSKSSSKLPGSQPLRKMSAPVAVNNKTLQRLLSPPNPRMTRQESLANGLTSMKLNTNVVRTGTVTNGLSRSGSIRTVGVLNKGVANVPNVLNPSTVSQQNLQMAVQTKRAQTVEPSLIKSKKTWR